MASDTSFGSVFDSRSHGPFTGSVPGPYNHGAHERPNLGSLMLVPIPITIMPVDVAAWDVRESPCPLQSCHWQTAQPGLCNTGVLLLNYNARRRYSLGFEGIVPLTIMAPVTSTTEVMCPSQSWSSHSLAGGHLPLTIMALPRVSGAASARYNHGGQSGAGRGGVWKGEKGRLPECWCSCDWEDGGLSLVRKKRRVVFGEGLFLLSLGLSLRV